MKRLLIIFIIIVFTALPIVIDVFAHMYSYYPFTWSLLLIPNLLIMLIYPRWNIILGSLLFYTGIKYIVEFIQHGYLHGEMLVVLVSSSLVNWGIYLTVAYFRIHYKRLLEEVNKLALVDPLTGLYNRRYLEQYFNKALSARTASPTNLVLVIVDIDHFKQINDTYGHACGDLALKHLTKMVRRTIRKSDKLIRLGGEEFAILLPNTTIENGVRLAKRVRENVELAPFVYKEHTISMTISAGVSEHNGQTTADFIESADRALYRAKQSGRNQVTVINEGQTVMKIDS